MDAVFHHGVQAIDSSRLLSVTSICPFKTLFQVWIFWIFGRCQEKDTGHRSEKQQAVHFTGEEGAGQSKLKAATLLVEYSWKSLTNSCKLQMQLKSQGQD